MIECAGVSLPSYPILSYLTLQGAVYGIIAARLSDQSVDEPYSYQAYAIILPWASNRPRSATIGVIHFMLAGTSVCTTGFNEE